MRRGVRALAAAALLSGCARYVAQPVSVERNAARFDARTLGDPGLTAFLRASLPAGAPAWGVGRLSLAALYFQPGIEVARSRLAVALGATRTAGQVANPTVSASAFYNLVITHPTPWTVGLVVNFLVESLGRRGARVAQAGALAEAARSDIATAGWAVRAKVREALLALWAARARGVLARGAAGAQGQVAALDAARAAAGRDAGPEAARARIAALAAEGEAAAQERAEAEALGRLAEAVGVPAGALRGVDVSTAAFEGAGPEGEALDEGELRRAALTRRSDVLAAVAEYGAAEAGVRLQVAAQYPNLVVGPGANYGNLDAERLSTQVGVPFALELPVFNRNEGPIAEALARRREAAAALVGVQAGIAGAVDGAAAGLGAARAAQAAAARVVAAAGQVDAQAARALAGGASDRPARLAAALALGEARRGAVEARLSGLEALGRLEDAAQQPLFEPALWPAGAGALPGLPGEGAAGPAAGSGT
ncbi:MAG: TolC family protein [Janthinobacterium lividum]